MKRALSALERDQLERENDDLVRAQIVAEEEEHAALARKRARTAVLTGEWRKQVEKWEQMGLRSLEEHSIVPPSPSPRLGILSSPFSLSPLTPRRILENQGVFSRLLCAGRAQWLRSTSCTQKSPVLGTE